MWHVAGEWDLDKGALQRLQGEPWGHQGQHCPCMTHHRSRSTHDVLLSLAVGGTGSHTILWATPSGPQSRAPNHGPHSHTSVESVSGFPSQEGRPGDSQRKSTAAGTAWSDGSHAAHRSALHITHEMQIKSRTRHTSRSPQTGRGSGWGSQ